MSRAAASNVPGMPTVRRKSPPVPLGTSPEHRVRADRSTLGVEESVDHLVERPIASDGDDGAVAARERGANGGGRVTGGDRLVHVELHAGGAQRARGRRPVSQRVAPGARRVHHDERGERSFRRCDAADDRAGAVDVVCHRDLERRDRAERPLGAEPAGERQPDGAP